MGKGLILMGLMIMLLGVFVSASESGKGFPWLGRLPGDIHIAKPGFSFHFPVTSCLLVSVLLTVVMRLLRR